MSKEKKEMIDIVKRMIADGIVKKEVAEKYIPELAESEDEKIRKWIIGVLEALCKNTRINIALNPEMMPSALAWLEKQGEHYNFRQKIQVGDQVTRNEDGMLVNLSQLKRVAKPEQKPVEWSEEDEDMRYKATVVLNKLCASNEEFVFAHNTLVKVFNWLKSLRPQKQ